MRVHEIAHRILTEVGHPISSREIAQTALSRGLATSAAQNPVFSLSSTIEKTIREDVYNKPPLRFVQGPKGRLVALQEWLSDPPKDGTSDAKSSLVVLALPADFQEPIHLVIAAGLASSEQDALLYLIRMGANASISEIRRGLEEQITRLQGIAKKL